jgi:hypothetical protein
MSVGQLENLHLIREFIPSARAFRPKPDYRTQSAAPPQEQTSSNACEGPDDHGQRHARPKRRAVHARLRCDAVKVMNGMSQVQCGQ